jgi:hypothetical protein
MPNDAKLGLVIGVGLVIAVAVLFFRRDLIATHPAGERPPPGIVNPPAAPPASPRGVQGYPVRDQPMSRKVDARSTPSRLTETPVSVENTDGP